MRKIGILVFGNKESGGVYQYTQSIIDALKNDNSSKYIVFCSSDDVRFDNYGLEVRKIDKQKSSIFKKIIRIFQFQFSIQRPLFFTKQEFDIFKDIDMFLSPTISAYPHFYLDKPFVFTLHDMQERYYPEFFSKKERLSRWLNNKTLAKSASKIICESNFVKNDIVTFFGIRDDKIFVIESPPPADFLNFKFQEDNLNFVKSKYNLPERFIFYPAQCWFHKNHIKLVESFKKVSNKNKDIYLVLTGSQQNNYNNLMQKIDELNLNDKVKHLGYIDYADLPYIYKLSQFLVMPTLFESVSIPIYEAFSLEVAVCGSDVVALPEQVGDAGLLFNPNDIDNMAKIMLQYIENDEVRIEKARLGLKKVANFNHDEYRKNLLKVLL